MKTFRRIFLVISTVEQPGHEAEPQVVSFPAPFETHDIIAQAQLTSSRLRVASLPVAPQPLRPGQPNTWRWIVVPERAGHHQVLIGVDL